MGLFDFLKKKETSEPKNEKGALLAMPLFINNESYNIDSVIQNLKNLWGLSIINFSGDNNSAVFTVNNELVTIFFVPGQIPGDEVSTTIKYAYNWHKAEEDLKNYTGHAVVSVMSAQGSQIERYTILSKLLCSILSTSNSIGVYQGKQTLLIPRNQYLENIDDLQQGKSPAHLWVYIGIKTSEEGNYLYTYGLPEFDKQEMEIIKSPKELLEVFNFFANIVSYVINGDITLRNGETLGYTEDQKIKITASQGMFVEGQTLRLEM
ncbi:DUF4261 domain-containing protein [Flavobacterium sp. DG2-3]|uniref:DUF4261 domain-containing protein n=1 Tax=Flavobacterium sp. DG2-3 TaxID=3068317 RepID=UPI0027400882|nr:DUF4261 domain-containing protein [Flavobacterium sp. DG2-3]MDP5200141.1 DUF4261 domain-containing protein [Flavobacterium sp. DG2-3]